MGKKILVIHGPNLNLLGKRQPDIYGHDDFDAYFSHLRSLYTGVELYYFQSNHEGELVDVIQESENTYDAAIINAGGYSHTSVAIADAVAASNIPYIGVHISNIYSREPERHMDLLAKYCKGVIVGLGFKAYDFAIQYILESSITDDLGLGGVV
jgi:3-dehydroquinate dehydratase-2